MIARVFHAVRKGWRTARRHAAAFADRGARPLAVALVAAALTPLLFSPGPQPVEQATDVHVAVDTAPDPGAGAARAGSPAADTRARPVVARTVDTVRPDVVIRPDEALEAAALFGILTLPDVVHLAGAVEIEIEVATEEAEERLRVFVVDPTTFRRFTPDATAQAPGVWERLLDGEMVIRHDVAQRLQLPLGDFVTAVGPSGDPQEVRVGAFASNGSPPFADALIPWSVGGPLGAGLPNVVVIAIDEEADPEVVGHAIAAHLDSAQVDVIEPPAEQRARLVGAGGERFEPFTYVSHGDGMITIDPAWVREWIVSAEVPIFGTVRCHRLMIPQLIAALSEIEERGLDRHIDTRDYGGCWVPRHILFNPNRRLSMHAWGLAIDFNVSTNQYGATPQMPPEIVEVFERWGFSWGGHWTIPDGMHFELRAVIRP
jgi:hypothetical protein